MQRGQSKPVNPDAHAAHQAHAYALHVGRLQQQGPMQHPNDDGHMLLITHHAHTTGRQATATGLCAAAKIRGEFEGLML